MQITAVLLHTCFDMNMNYTAIDLGLCLGCLSTVQTARSVFCPLHEQWIISLLIWLFVQKHAFSGDSFALIPIVMVLFTFLCCLHALCSPCRLYNDLQCLPPCSLRVIWVPSGFCAMPLLENLAALNTFLRNSPLPELLIQWVSLVALLRSCRDGFGGVQLRHRTLDWK